MKKGKLTITITIGLTVLIFTAVIFIQFKTINQTDITSLENMREEELKAEISSFKQKSEEISNQIEETDLKIAEYEETISTDKQASELLSKELEQQNNLLGKNDVKGSGVIVTLTDTRAQKITAEDLRALLNELKTAGAEAISINGQRIVAMSDIFKIGSGDDAFLKVNGERILPSYIINAIGNQTYLESAVVGKGGYVDILQELGHKTSIQKSKKIKIEKYKGTIGTKYLN